MELITSDELATFVRDALVKYNEDFFIDGSAEEFFELTDVNQEGSTLNVTATNVSRTRTITFAIVVRG